jgi:hypothetical protein
VSRYVYHLAPSDEETRRSIRRWGLLPSRPAMSGKWDEGLECQRRGVYVVQGRPERDAFSDIYRIELPRGLRTYHDSCSTP